MVFKILQEAQNCCFFVFVFVCGLFFWVDIAASVRTHLDMFYVGFSSKRGFPSKEGRKCFI